MDVNNVTNFLDEISIKVVVKNQYFDFRNIDHPIQSYIEELYEYSIEKLGIYFGDVFVKQNQYETQDDYFNILGPKKGKFFDTQSHKDSDLDTLSIPKNFAYFNFWIDNQEEFYERTVYSFLDFVGQVGGIVELFLIFTVIFIAPISGTLLEHEIISNMNSSKSFKKVKELNLKNTEDISQNKTFPMRLIEEEKETPNYDSKASIDEKISKIYQNKFI